jgi:Rrf2 family transcriptional regulator, cysteine metabolism repressor
VRITAKAEYACMAMISLARLQSENRPVHIKEIADEQSIPLSTLTQVLLKLKGAGLVRSTRGSAGGYTLARAPEEIKLGEVLTAIDGQNGVARELSGASAQVLASVWYQILEREREVLAATSIAQLAGRSVSINWVI